MSGTPSEDVRFTGLRPSEFPKPSLRRLVTAEAAPIEPLTNTADVTLLPSKIEPETDGEPRSSARGPERTGPSFLDLPSLLEHQSREWTAMVRQLERHRQHLAAVESEQEASYAQLERVLPVVQNSFRSLKEAVENTKRGATAGRADEVAAVNGRALEELERVAGSLAAQAQWYRQAWEQYTRTVEEARRLDGRMRDPLA